MRAAWSDLDLDRTPHPVFRPELPLVISLAFSHERQHMDLVFSQVLSCAVATICQLLSSVGKWDAAAADQELIPTWSWSWRQGVLPVPGCRTDGGSEGHLDDFAICSSIESRYCGLGWPNPTPNLWLG